MPSPLIQNLFSALLDSPSIVVEVTAQTLEEAIPVIQSHFTFSGYEITKAYQDACRYSFVAISIGLDAPDSLIKKLRYPKVTRKFARQINEFYFQEFAEKHEGIDVVSFINSLKNFANKTKLLFEINEISEEDLAALIGNRGNIEISELILQQMQNVEPVDDNLAAFLGFKNLLGDSVLFFFRELLRQDERIHRTQAALQQQRLCIDVQEISQQIQYLQQWQVQHQQIIAVQNRFAIKLEQILDWAQDIKDDIAEINSKLDQILIAQQQTLSSKIEYLDGTKRYNFANQQIIANLFKQLPELSSQHPEYGQVINKFARLLSSIGALDKAEFLLQHLINTTKFKADKALAYFNLFQISWRKANLFQSSLRKAFAISSSAEKEKIYAQALAALQNAIDLDKPDQHYVLHDINTGYYPIEKLLSAGGMGCVFLCGNHNTLNKDEYPKVVVKCFWQNISGDLQTVFDELSAMHQLREYVPKPLGFGYADNKRQIQAYFVTEYIEGAIDGEAWLEKQGALDLNTGLQVALQIATALQYAHEHNIYHLDLKPSNLLLLKAKSKVSVKLINFGIAEIQSQKSTEASSHSGLTSNSDIFAFGMTMYRLLTAKQPHPFIKRQLPESVRELLCNCVENEPAERPKSGDLVKSLTAIIDKRKKLSVTNPLDYLRLLWSLFIMPQTLENYDNEDDVAKWLLSTLIFLPLLIPNLALGLGLLPAATEKAFFPNTFLWISWVLGMGWFVMGLFGDGYENLVTLANSIFGWVFGFVFGWVFSSLTGGWEFSLVFGLAGGLVFGLALEDSGLKNWELGLIKSLVVGLVGGLVGGMAGGMAEGLTIMGLLIVILFVFDEYKESILALVFFISIILTGGIIGYMKPSILGIDATVFVSIIATITIFAIYIGVFFGIFLTSSIVKNSIKDKTPSWIVRIAFFSLIINYIFLIYYFFLDGWRLFV